MEINRREKSIFVGVVTGLIISVILLYTQQIESMFYFSSAPLCIDSLTIDSDGLVSIVTFVYYIVIFGFIGYLSSITSKWKSAFLIGVLVATIATHIVLTGCGAETVFSWMRS